MLLIIAVFIGSYLMAQRSAGWAMTAIIWVGGVYGIVRANNPDTVTYFMFDTAVFAVYMARLPMMLKPAKHMKAAFQFTLAILVWPLFYFGMGFIFPQHPLIQLVGLRAAIWFIPFILIGTQMRGDDFKVLAVAVAVMNLVAFGFAMAEFALGVEMFYPRNAVTEIIYNSKDIADRTEFRIPATFSNSASYGVYLVVALPVLVSRLADQGSPLPNGRS